jgi:hypothetical protein
MICRVAVELVCRSLDAPLSLGERTGLRAHTLFCGPCRRFRRQLFRLHDVWETAVNNGLPAAGGLPAEARERIAATLGKAPPAE